MFKDLKQRNEIFNSLNVIIRDSAPFLGPCLNASKFVIMSSSTKAQIFLMLHAFY